MPFVCFVVLISITTYSHFNQSARGPILIHSTVWHSACAHVKFDMCIVNCSICEPSIWNKGKIGRLTTKQFQLCAVFSSDKHISFACMNYEIEHVSFIGLFTFALRALDTRACGCARMCATALGNNNKFLFSNYMHSNDWKKV